MWFNFICCVVCCRRARECTEEDISEMGELAFGEGEQPHRRSVRGSEGRQESSQAARGSLRGETGIAFLYDWTEINYQIQYKLPLTCGIKNRGKLTMRIIRIVAEIEQSPYGYIQRNFFTQELYSACKLKFSLHE